MSLSLHNLHVSNVSNCEDPTDELPRTQSEYGDVSRRFSRRAFINLSLAAASIPTALTLKEQLNAAASQAKDAPVKSVAAIITAYQEGLHADVLVGKILEGWQQDGGRGPALKLASMYVEQFPPRDMARPMSEKYHVPIFETIEQALTLGGSKIAVDGVLSIGEHGSYPFNAKLQQLYPRRRFFEQITNAFEKYKRVVPVFNDKHLGPEWPDALWMYNRARELKVPFMAGSSMTVGFREPDVSLPIGCEVESALAVGYSGLDIYGIHALEFLQCFVERRGQGETGVEWVQCLQGDGLWKAVDDGAISAELLWSVLAVTPHSKDADIRKTAKATLFLFQYCDGLKGSVLMLPGFAASTGVSLKVKGKNQPVACRFLERTESRHPHFAYLLKAIERMIYSGKPSYPVERTLLTSGILDRALTSLAEGQRRLATPELKIGYAPIDYPHAPHIDLFADPGS